MEFGQLMIDILVNVSCKFEMYIFKTAQVINENVRIVFLYVLSIFLLETKQSIGLYGNLFVIVMCNAMVDTLVKLIAFEGAKIASVL